MNAIQILSGNYVQVGHFVILAPPGAEVDYDQQLGLATVVPPMAQPPLTRSGLPGPLAPNVTLTVQKSNILPAHAVHSAALDLINTLPGRAHIIGEREFPPYEGQSAAQIQLTYLTDDLRPVLFTRIALKNGDALLEATVTSDPLDEQSHESLRTMVLNASVIEDASPESRFTRESSASADDEALERAISPWSSVSLPFATRSPVLTDRAATALVQLLTGPGQPTESVQEGDLDTQEIREILEPLGFTRGHELTPSGERVRDMMSGGCLEAMLAVKDSLDESTHFRAWFDDELAFILTGPSRDELLAGRHAGVRVQHLPVGALPHAFFGWLSTRPSPLGEEAVRVRARGKFGFLPERLARSGFAPATSPTAASLILTVKDHAQGVDTFASGMLLTDDGGWWILDKFIGSFKMIPVFTDELYSVLVSSILTSIHPPTDSTEDKD